MIPKAFIGIAGGTCSGKTLVSNRLTEEVGEENVLICKQDSYYYDLRDIPIEKRAEWNFDRPGAFDYDLILKNMQQLLLGKAIQEPIYSYVEHIRTGEFRTLQPRPVVILEGILTYDEQRLRELMNFKVFVDEDADIRLARRLSRDVTERGRSSQSVIDQYITTVRPAHLAFVEPQKRHADIIIPRGGENNAAIEILSNHIKALL